MRNDALFVFLSLAFSLGMVISNILCFCKQRVFLLHVQIGHYVYQLYFLYSLNNF